MKEASSFSRATINRILKKLQEKGSLAVMEKLEVHGCCYSGSMIPPQVRISALYDRLYGGQFLIG